MEGGVGRPTWQRLGGVGPSVPIVPPGGDQREQRQKDRSRRAPRPVERPPSSDDRPGDDGSPGPDTEEHRVDIVV
jgi:hypothetical protein